MALNEHIKEREYEINSIDSPFGAIYRSSHPHYLTHMHTRALKDSANEILISGWLKQLCNRVAWLHVGLLNPRGYKVMRKVFLQQFFIEKQMAKALACMLKRKTASRPVSNFNDKNFPLLPIQMCQCPHVFYCLFLTNIQKNRIQAIMQINMNAYMLVFITKTLAFLTHWEATETCHHSFTGFHNIWSLILWVWRKIERDYQFYVIYAI